MHSIASAILILAASILFVGGPHVRSDGGGLLVLLAIALTGVGGYGIVQDLKGRPPEDY